MAVAEQFATNLVNCRNHAGLTQEDVSWQADLHRTAISQLERGLRIPRLDTIVKLAGALEIPPCQLLDGMKWTPAVPVYGRFDFNPSDAS